MCGRPITLAVTLSMWGQRVTGIKWHVILQFHLVSSTCLHIHLTFPGSISVATFHNAPFGSCKYISKKHGRLILNTWFHRNSGIFMWPLPTWHTILVCGIEVGLWYVGVIGSVLSQLLQLLPIIFTQRNLCRFSKSNEWSSSKIRIYNLTSPYLVVVIGSVCLLILW
jgi:hypothetical protein